MAAARKRSTSRKAAPVTKMNPSKARSPKAVSAAPVKERKVPEAFQAKTGDAKLVDAAKQAQDAVATATTKRDEAIVAAVKGGASARQVAIALGLPHGAVLRITR